MMDPVPSLEINSRRKNNALFRDKVNFHINTLLLNKGWIFVIVGFLLGRAVILSSVTPFAIAFLATIWFIHRKKSAKVMLAILVGAFSLSMIQGIFVTIALIVFIFLA